MPDASDITDTLATVASGPKSVTADGISVQQQSVDDHIKAANYVAAQEAKATTKGWLRFKTLVPPGCG